MSIDAQIEVALANCNRAICDRAAYKRNEGDAEGPMLSIVVIHALYDPATIQDREKRN